MLHSSNLRRGHWLMIRTRSFKLGRSRRRYRCLPHCLPAPQESPDYQSFWPLLWSYNSVKTHLFSVLLTERIKERDLKRGLWRALLLRTQLNTCKVTLVWYHILIFIVLEIRNVFNSLRFLRSKQIQPKMKLIKVL